jgi:hypothetical protein
MTEAEAYAVTLVADGAQEAINQDYWVPGAAGRILAYKISEAIRDNPESFLAWYHSTTAQEVSN